MGLFDWLKPKPQAEPEPEMPAPPSNVDIERALRKAEEMVENNQVSTPVLARVLRVTHLVRGILPRLENLGVSSEEAYTVVATATEYLPESLAGYLALPRDWADTRPVANGKSSLLLLIDQLDLLALTTSRMADAANRQDAATLVAQGAFLDAKFGGKNLAPTKLDDPEPTAKASGPLDIE
ncbi:hypothetical protein QP568_04125 [Propionimicrobium lymphophilum]|uniref:Uncharacterized protein n=1 Tax=Propionimicrobium lymphophilum ACS-093-V-SCH5 TaxID=883161 RepID=S2WX21_9ACTN|nr:MULTISPECIES: hypothetical protein [Propionimicrobium]EPD32274.1 hypothetical protein HMPREF9306_01843 [Propionimicrobium lymphophilum ACS-093-V-SCH5]ETJ97178.1 hypothetical protein HMPREF1255_1015 [Propionimicrobium sp. BV2F7]MDK7709499.1 hypothetical protein [Propionimicrobium lymphophilum]MDK7733485.1 hypothetical protein [Propionimicrobium lymphophilum]